jgi:hypothetical protein
MNNITFFETLFCYDGVEVFVAHDKLDTRYICLHVASSNITDTYLCTQISLGRLNSFKYGNTDLKTIYDTPENDDFFECCVENGNFDSISIKLIIKDSIPQNWYPQSGFYIHIDKPSDIKIVQESQERKKGIVHLSLNPPESYGESKISVNHLSASINIFQRLIKYAYGKATQLVDEKNVPFIRDSKNYELEVFAFSNGSFTVHMQTVAGTDLTGYANVSKALEILDAINFEYENPQKAIEVLSKYKGHLITSYKDLLKFVIENNTPISYEWSAPDIKKSITKQIVPFFAKPLYDAINEKKEIEIEERKLTGWFTKLDKKLGTWRLISEIDNKEYLGVSDTDLAGLVIQTKLYELDCTEEVEEERITGKELTKLHLKHYLELS